MDLRWRLRRGTDDEGRSRRAGRTKRRMALAALLSTAGMAAAVGVATVADAAPVKWISVSTGQHTTCGVKSDHTLWCWGENYYHQAGQPDRNADYPRPRRVGTSKEWATVALGSSFGCALRTDGTLYCWGKNSFGQLGLGDDDSGRMESSPVKVGVIHYKQLSAANETACAVTKGKNLYCWGGNFQGNLGVGDTEIRTSPTRVGSLGWAQVRVGYGSTCATMINDTGYCWGTNTRGEITGSTDDNAQILTPHPAPGDLRWAEIQPSYIHTCGRTTTGEGYCWGFGEREHALGTDDVDPATGLHRLPADDWVSIAGGLYSSCGLEADGDHVDRYCWGINGNAYGGQLGLDLDVGVYVEEPSRLVGESLPWATVTGAQQWYYYCGLTTGGDLYCWGENQDGQIGDGTTTDARKPVKIRA